MKKYDPKYIEKKWQKYWEANKTFEVKEDYEHPEKKFYSLIEFPYPSGEGLHVGHPRPFTAMDVVSRKKRMEGYNVLYPMGFDAFGLPTENFAIKTGKPPAEVTKKNIANFTRQLKSLGYSFDWSRAVDTTDPKYYKWTQWIFLQFFKHGLAYKKTTSINWCPKDKIGLANEEAAGGVCDRCGGPVEKRDKEQWMLAITKYADKLLSGLKTVDYITPARVQQENWIGRSEGIQYHQKVKDLGIELEAYDSVPQTFVAQTFAVIAPEHPVVEQLIAGTEYEKPVRKFVNAIKKKKLTGKFDVDKETEGIFTGRYIENPFGMGDLPIWIASFVIADYGTGFVNCSAHDQRDFDFAKKYNIPLRPVMFPADATESEKVKNLEYCYTHAVDGILNEVTPFPGRKWGEVREDIMKYLEEKGLGKRQVNYKLRDWVFSRQRYWGEPIPLVYCEKCAEWVPLPESELPLELPKVEKYQPTDTGESPLAAMHKWVNTKCPKCKGPAKRETDTMPNWAGSSWYFLRYCDPHNDKEFAAMKKLKYWMDGQSVIASAAKQSHGKQEIASSPLDKLEAPRNDASGGVDWYNGGMEHTVLHLLYSRFWNLFLSDLGLVPTSEPYKKRTSHGMILASDGEKMSKSRGNVINPDEMIEKFGSDAFRSYIMFMGPFDQAVMWDTNGLVGVRRFIEKVWGLKEKVASDPSPQSSPAGRGGAEPSPQRRGQGEVADKQTLSLLHQTIKKVSEDIERMGFNTAIAKMMEFANYLSGQEEIAKNVYLDFIKLLSPFAPHMCEELWSIYGHGVETLRATSLPDGSLAFQPWPKYDAELAKTQTITVAVQVNGRVRDELTVSPEISEEEIKKLVLASEKVLKWLEGKQPKKIIYVKGRLVSVVV